VRAVPGTVRPPSGRERRRVRARGGGGGVASNAPMVHGRSKIDGIRRSKEGNGGREGAAARRRPEGRNHQRMAGHARRRWDSGQRKGGEGGGWRGAVAAVGSGEAAGDVIWWVGDEVIVGWGREYPRVSVGKGGRDATDHWQRNWRRPLGAAAGGRDRSWGEGEGAEERGPAGDPSVHPSVAFNRGGKGWTKP